MIKKTILPLAATAALATAAAIASASPAHSARARTLALVEIQRSSAQLDLGAKGFSPGDRQTITSDVYTRSGRRAGRLDDDCAITQTGKEPEAVCTFVLTLRGGQLTGSFAQSLAGADAGKRQAITGGTGRYAGAHGELRAGKEGKRTPFSVALR